MFIRFGWSPIYSIVDDSDKMNTCTDYLFIACTHVLYSTVDNNTKMCNITDNSTNTHVKQTCSTKVDRSTVKHVNAPIYTQAQKSVKLVDFF